MGYFVMPKINEGYEKRRGLEGPFNFTGRVLYYDPVVGQYYDPKTDFYVEQDEMDEINRAFMERFKQS